MPDGYEEILEAIDETIAKWKQGLKYARRREKMRAFNCLVVNPCPLCSLVYKLRSDCCGCIVTKFANIDRCDEDDDVDLIFYGDYDELTYRDIARSIERVLSKLNEMALFVKDRIKKDEFWSSYTVKCEGV